jgi:hypothetical protein
MGSYEPFDLREKKKGKTPLQKCGDTIKDYCSPFCLCGATVFGLSVLAYDILSYTAAQMGDSIYRIGGEMLQNFPQNITQSNFGESVVEMRSDLKESMSYSVDVGSKKFGVSCAVGYYLSRKVRGTFRDWWSGRKKDEQE